MLGSRAEGRRSEDGGADAGGTAVVLAGVGVGVFLVGDGVGRVDVRGGGEVCVLDSGGGEVDGGGVERHCCGGAGGGGAVVVVVFCDAGSLRLKLAVTLCGGCRRRRAAGKLANQGSGLGFLAAKRRVKRAL